MGTRRDGQRAKARDRKKKSRAKAQQARKSRALQGKPTVDRAKSWPVAEAWLSDNWHNEGAEVHGVLVRTHSSSGNAAAIFVHANLDQVGFETLDVQVGVPEGLVRNKLVELAEEVTFMEVAPEQVSRLVYDARRLAVRCEQELPRNLQDALALLEGIDERDAPFDFKMKEDDDDEPTEEVPKRRGLFSALFGG